ncbi:hypothetical protein SAMN05216474_0055 [Lishizhenia tianjinensis]|uniref:Uncharacterized protein n=1 Tax=Lishizhenia tianjinensis TaxID=477690 RepID=A0A1I6XAH3_9FLAO|nr:hypothetical protein [Lishizhenia tianjinensis]SFT35328.1 hypothetical protein SAMN05216474_0055 [Lishizhenia tianjinensis]
MPLKSNATADEKTSPFYLKNEELCREWENYITEKNGQLKGVYNASSFHIEGRIETTNTWSIEVKKATFSSGNLLLSSKYQNLQEILTLSTKISNTTSGNFRICKSIFKRKSQKHPLYKKVNDLFIADLDSGELYEIVFKKQQLTFTYHHCNERFDIVNKIINLDLNSEA